MLSDLGGVRIASRMSSTAPGNPSLPYLILRAGCAACGEPSALEFCGEFCGCDQAEAVGPRRWTRGDSATRNSATMRTDLPTSRPIGTLLAHRAGTSARAGRLGR